MQRRALVVDDERMLPSATILWLKLLASTPACASECDTHCADCVPDCLETCEEQCTGRDCTTTCEHRCARGCLGCAAFCRRRLGCATDLGDAPRSQNKLRSRSRLRPRAKRERCRVRKLRHAPHVAALARAATLAPA